MVEHALKKGTARLPEEKGRRGMAGIKRGVVVGAKSPALERLLEEVRPVVTVTEWHRENNAAYSSFSANPPSLVFVDLSEETKGRLILITRIVKTIRHVPVVALGQNAQVDLLLQAFRAGAHDYLALPPVAGEGSAMCRRLLDPSFRREEEGKVFSVFSVKGGQGITTIAVNLADRLRKLTTRETLLFDMNFFAGDCETRLKIPSLYTPFDLQRDMKRIDRDLLLSVVPKHDRGFRLLACPDEISDPEQIQGEEVGRMMEILAEYMDFTVIDLPHDLSTRTMAALRASDRILLVLQQNLASLKSARKALRFFREMGEKEEKVELVLNRYEKRNDLSVDDMADVLGRPLFHLLRNDYRASTESINLSVPLDATDRKGPLNRDMGVLAEKCAGFQEPRRSQRSLLRSLMDLPRKGRS
jgi:pilus assembly protein CpaE